MLKTCDDLTRAMLDEGLSRSRMLHQTVPSKGDNVFCLHCITVSC